jgi:hypothetical protein
MSDTHSVIDVAALVAGGLLIVSWGIVTGSYGSSVLLLAWGVGMLLFAHYLWTDVRGDGG